MSGYIQRILGRAQQNIAVIQPRPVSRFEHSAVPSGLFETEEPIETVPVKNSIKKTPQAQEFPQIKEFHYLPEKPKPQNITESNSDHEHEMQAGKSINSKNVQDHMDTPKPTAHSMSKKMVSFVNPVITNTVNQNIENEGRVVHIPGKDTTREIVHTVEKVNIPKMNLQSKIIQPDKPECPETRTIVHESTRIEKVHIHGDKQNIPMPWKEKIPLPEKNDRITIDRGEKQIHPLLPVNRKLSLTPDPIKKQDTSTVSINIGTVEIHAATSQKKPVIVHKNNRQPVMSLDEYLSQKSGGF